MHPKRKRVGNKKRNYGNKPHKKVGKRSSAKRDFGHKRSPVHSGKFIEGAIRVTGRGRGTIEGPNGELIKIEEGFLNTALHGDTVRVSILAGHKSGEKFGVVEKVLLRKSTNIVGTVRFDHIANATFLISDDRRMYTAVLLLGRNHPPEGHKVVAELLPWKDPRVPPEATVVRVLGKAGEHETEIAAITAEFNVRSDFPEKALSEASYYEREFNRLLASEAKNRRDFRTVPTCTIDPVDAKDFDDALSIRKLENGSYEVGIHIADVSFFVKPGSALDHLAAERATSVYLVDRTIPMLPEALSNNLCSLNPNEDRLAYATVVTLSPKAAVEKVWFGRTLIRSQKRFTYEEAQKVIEQNAGPLAHELNVLNLLAKKLRKERVQQGSVIFDRPEVKVILNEKKQPIGVQLKELKDSNHLVEEFMLLANRLVAEHIGKQKKFKAFVYRVHDVPDREKIELLGSFLRGMGHEIPIQKNTKNVVAARDINALLSAIRGTSEENLIQTATVRSMAKAIYSTKNIGHFGLGFAYYTHFTSPIRRYPDILVHRLLEQHLKGKPLAAGEIVALEKATRHSSEREQEAAEAERSSVRFKQLEILAPKVGQEFDAIISGVSDWAIFVEEQSVRVDGMVRLASLPDDYYQLDEKRYAVVGTRTKKMFRLGDAVRVRLLAANPLSRSAEFAII